MRSKQSGFLRAFPGLKDNPRKFFLQTTFIILVLLTGFWHLKAAFMAQMEMNRGAQMADFAHSLSNPDALATLARKEHLANVNLPLALDLYQTALDNFVLHVPSWLGLAEIYNDQGKKAQGIKALEFLQSFAENNEDTAWSKTLLANSLGNEKIMTDNLLWLATNSPGKRRNVFSLATNTWDEPEIIMNKFGPQFFMDILNVYIQNNDIGKTWIVWGQMRQNVKNTPENALKYINYLLSQNELQVAHQVWKNSINRTGTLLYNGSFDQPITGSGFGWRITKAKGVSWEKGEYGVGLKITFDGTENPSFQLAQTVPLVPGKYVFSGTYEADALTTDQRPFWSISGAQCLRLQSEGPMMLPPSEHQTDFIIRFTVPNGCEAVQIGLRRNKSYHFDNKISGNVIVNKLRVRGEGEELSAGSDQDASSSAENKKSTHIKINKINLSP